MDEDSSYIDEKIEKYNEMVKRGKTISDLRSIKEEKEDELERIKSGIRRKKNLFKHAEGKKETKKKIHELEDRRYDLLKEILAIESIIGDKDNIEIDEEDSSYEALSDDYKPLRYISAEEAEEYGFDLARLERILRIERWLDKNHPEWIVSDIPSSAKRKLESYFDEVEPTTIEKDIRKARNRIRKIKIEEYLIDEHPEWHKKDPPSGAKDYLTNLLNISDKQFKEYLQDLRREREHG
jgi:vacuolar-type H+-ATPase subunit I/STV1